MTLSNLLQYRPGALLAEGEENRVHRIRATTEVHQWLAAMTAAQRGEVLAAAYAATIAPKPDVTPDPEPTPEKRRSPRHRPDVTPEVTSGVSAPEGFDLLTLRPIPRRSALSAAQIALVDIIEAGAALYSDPAGGYILVLSNGAQKAQHPGPVNSLRRAGLFDVES